MSYVPLEKCLDRSNGSIYKLTVMVAKRAQEIAEGAKVLLNNNNQTQDKPLRIALKEIAQGLLEIEGPKKVKK